MLSLANELRCFGSLLYKPKWLDLRQHYRTVATGRKITIEDISKKLSNFEKSVSDPQESSKFKPNSKNNFVDEISVSNCEIIEEQISNECKLGLPV